MGIFVENPPIQSQPDIIFVTGMSGAGRSAALKIFEDLGYSAIDNLPLVMIEGLMNTMVSAQLPLPMVVGIDFHTTKRNISHFHELLTTITKKYTVRVIFLDCRDEVLLRRYAISRRRHPIGGQSVMASIHEERTYFRELLTFAHHIMDTSDVSVITLARIIKNIFALRSSPELQIRLLSFSYRHGLPQDADIVLDARFLVNPHYEAPLQYLTGQDPEVANFILKDENWPAVFTAMKEMLIPVIHGVNKSGRSYLTIAIGCTGGRHRSVFTAEKIAAYLKDFGAQVAIEHRELATGN